MERVKAMEGISFGCDPELFVIDPDGEFVSAEGLIPGTKAEPYKVEKGAVQVDGMAAEFNIDPVTTYEGWEDNISSVMKTLKKMLPKGYRLAAIPAVSFSEREWDKSPSKAKELGCSPDFNAWTGGVNPPPNDPDNPRLRTASGHIHVGWTDNASPSDLQHIINCRDVVKQFDYFLGAWSLSKDPDPTRRRLYGKAGACRYKPYGVEYRVLSNFWLRSKERRAEVWDRMQSAVWSIKDMQLPDLMDRFDFNARLIESIDSSVRDARLEQQFVFPIKTLNPPQNFKLPGSSPRKSTKFIVSNWASDYLENWNAAP